MHKWDCKCFMVNPSLSCHHGDKSSWLVGTRLSSWGTQTHTFSHINGELFILLQKS